MGNSPFGASSTDDDTADFVGSALLDRFTRQDELLESIDEHLDQIRSQQLDVLDALGVIADAIGADVDVSPPRYTYDLSHDVPADTPPQDPVTIRWEAPQDGELRRVKLLWPESTQQAVGIGIDDPAGNRIAPRGPTGQRFHALNDATLEPEPRISLDKGEELVVETVNTDPENDHKITIVPAFIPE